MFKEYFDRIFLLNLVENKNRRDFMFSQFNQLGCNDEVEVHNAVLHPFCDIIINAFNKSGKGKFTKPNEFNCAREHYSIIKQAYEEGANRVMVMEDDLCLLQDKEKLKEYLENLPDDFDILQMSCITPYKNIVHILKDNLRSKNPKYWMLHEETPMWGAAMYVLNRRGMVFYMKCQDQLYQVADMPLYLTSINHKVVTSYISSIPLGIQENIKVIHSDIRQGEHMNGQVENYYEHKIDRTKYFSYSSNK